MFKFFGSDSSEVFLSLCVLDELISFLSNVLYVTLVMVALVLPVCSVAACGTAQRVVASVFFDKFGGFESIFESTRP